ncbi:hypothetical protein GWK77_01910 [Candidatus Saccharibacteria bacterium oral taxon 488]|nr:hypothetical protein GWK77_01910 [Candidatus Saccharibacteria bacterium oral taxon 488]
MATWNPADRKAALDKAAAGERLSDFEVRKLQEAGRQIGSWGTAAKKAVAKDEKQFGKR